MFKITRFLYVFLNFILVACATASPAPPTVTSTPAALAPTSFAVASPTTPAEISSTANATVPAKDATLELSESSQYTIGTREIKFSDPARDGMEIYAVLRFPGNGGEPDQSRAPYPVIIYSHGGDVDDGMSHRSDNWVLLSHLASYGYVIAAPQHDTEAALTFTDRPMDILALIAELDRLAGGEFAGVLDMEKIGIIGTSVGTPTTLQMGGARLDHNYFDTWCTNHPDGVYCPSAIVDRYKRTVSETLLVDSNGLYYVNSDARIRALVLLAPCFQPMFGERGLATVSLPILLLAPTQDEFCAYQDETVPMFQHLGSKDRYLINIISGTHNSILFDPMSHRIVVTAFFDYFIKGKGEYAQYLTEDYVNTLQGLSWGVYQP
jgi:predicted dienelactone hydrolase